GPATRFNAYNTLLSIQKDEKESLPSLTARVEKAMQEIKGTRPDAFTISDLDGDLMCLALTRPLPPQYSSFVSSLILLPQFDFPTLKEAFQLQEENDKAAGRYASVAAAAQLASVASVASVASKQPKSFSRSNKASSSYNQSNRFTCEFCNVQGHSQDRCFQYKHFQLQARLKALERSSHQKAPSTSSPLSSSSPATNTSFDQASHVQSDTDSNEFAGNASTLSSSSSPQSSHSLRWCADTGATSHMTPHREWFTEYEAYTVPVRVADGTVVHSAGVGTVRFKPFKPYGGGSVVQEVVFNKVLHVPSLCNNLLSVLYLTGKQGFSVVIEKYTMSFHLKGHLHFTATQRGGLAYLDGSTLWDHSPQALAALSLLPQTLELWHRRFSHINYTDLKHMIASKLVTGLKVDSSPSPDPVCEPCIAGKQHRIVNKSATRTTVPLAIVHCDLHGPMPIRSPEGYRFFMVFVDDATRLWTLYLLKAKSDAPAAFWSYKASIENQTGHKIKVLHDDKEGGLSSNEFNAKLNECGILRRFTMRA